MQNDQSPGSQVIISRIRVTMYRKLQFSLPTAIIFSLLSYLNLDLEVYKKSTKHETIGLYRFLLLLFFISEKTPEEKLLQNLLNKTVLASVSLGFVFDLHSVPTSRILPPRAGSSWFHTDCRLQLMDEGPQFMFLVHNVRPSISYWLSWLPYVFAVLTLAHAFIFVCVCWECSSFREISCQSF